MGKHILPVYKPSELSFQKGDGCYLLDRNCKKFLDFSSGIAVNILGYNHPHLTTALKESADKVWHTSNIYTIPGQEILAQRLVENSFAEYVFFCNSGSEAVECAIKAARKYFYAKGMPEKNRIMTIQGCFHGRTMAAISAGGQKRHTEGFGPLLKGFDQVPFGDHDTIKQFITNQTAGILVEPILGEGGIKVIPEICLKGLREICSERKILLICDEIQSGMGRSGKFFSYEWANIKPDIVTVAKGLGGGFPIGACLTSKKVGEKMTFGSHGSTFGGNPLAVAVANAVLDIVFDKSFLRQVNEVSQYFFAGLEKLKNDSNQILEIRGKGLILGIKFGDETKCEVFVDKARENGLLIVKAAENVVRLLPPLIISKEQIDHGLKILKTTLEMK